MGANSQKSAVETQTELLRDLTLAGVKGGSIRNILKCDRNRVFRVTKHLKGTGVREPHGQA